jgi:hypothetical protein
MVGMISVTSIRIQSEGAAFNPGTLRAQPDTVRNFLVP